MTLPLWSIYTYSIQYLWPKKRKHDSDITHVYMYHQQVIFFYKSGDFTTRFSVSCCWGQLLNEFCQKLDWKEFKIKFRVWLQCLLSLNAACVLYILPATRSHTMSLWFQISLPDLEEFLRRKAGNGSSKAQLQAMELLWRYYEKNRNYAAAAKILNKLADKPRFAEVVQATEHKNHLGCQFCQT